MQNESLIQKIARLEKQVEHEKRLNSNLNAEIESCRKADRLSKESTLTMAKDHAKQVIDDKIEIARLYCSYSMFTIFTSRNQVNDLKRQNNEYNDRLEKQNEEMQRMNAKLKDTTLINQQLNDELNEKTEQICHLHSENSRCVCVFFLDSE